MEENNKKYIKVIIAKGNDDPYYIKGMGLTPDSCFIRVGSSIQSMPYDMINNRANKKTRISLRNIVSPKQDLTFSQLKIYYEEKGFKINNNFLLHRKTPNPSFLSSFHSPSYFFIPFL